MRISASLGRCGSDIHLFILALRRMESPFSILRSEILNRMRLGRYILHKRIRLMHHGHFREEQI